MKSSSGLASLRNSSLVTDRCRFSQVECTPAGTVASMRTSLLFSASSVTGRLMCSLSGSLAAAVAAVALVATG